MKNCRLNYIFSEMKQRCYNPKCTSYENYGWSVERAFETKDNCNLKMVVYKNKRQSLKEWCRELGLNYYKIRSRLNNYHWTIERAFETP